MVTAPELDALLAALRGAGLQALATTVDGGTRLDEAGELLTMPTVWLFGPESHGLPEEVSEQFGDLDEEHEERRRRRPRP